MTLLNFDARLQWVEEGLALGEREQSARSLMWDIGDWWNRGERYGDRVRIVTGDEWRGPTHQTCRDAGWVAARWEVSLRDDRLSFHHYRYLSVLKSNPLAKALAEWCLETIPPRSVEHLRTEIKRIKREAKEEELGKTQTAALQTTGRYGVIYADPPWRFEPYSRDTGMDRAADNHYPTMADADIGALPVPAADDAVLFMWATAPMLPQALLVMAAWGFEYRSHCVWVKDRVGTGYWFRNKHELLLVGTRGDIPAPAPGEQFGSVFEAAVGAHSAKPQAFAEMIEEMFPNMPAIEMFARGPRLGWAVWGNEVRAA